jgi:hypothetical protein
MKNLAFILYLMAGVSCAVTERSGLLPEDELFITRKYVGDFVECKATVPAKFGDPYILTITTTQDSIYGKISAYSKRCDFKPGERLYIRKVYQTTDVFGSWIYRIENENPDKVSYLICEFQDGNKVLTQNWF